MKRSLTGFATALLFAFGGPLLAADPAPASSVSHTIHDKALEWGPCPDFLPKGCAIAVLQGDPGQPNVDVFFKVPAGSTIPSHRHTSPERMVLVSGTMDVTYEGEATAHLKVGTYAYGPAGKAHHATCAKGADCVLFIAFESPLDAIPTTP